MYSVLCRGTKTTLRRPSRSAGMAPRSLTAHTCNRWEYSGRSTIQRKMARGWQPIEAPWLDSHSTRWGLTGRTSRASA